MLNDSQIERIEALWSPETWPDSADSYTIGGHRYGFSYYRERLRHLGLSGGVVADAGCGSGRWSFALATRFDHVIGFDFTPRRIATAIWLKERFTIDAVEFSVGDIRKIGLERESVEAVYCNSVVFGGDPLDKIFTEFHRILKRGGVCYIGLNASGYAYQLASYADPKLADHGRRRIYNTYCQRHLAALISAIAPRGRLNGRMREHLERGMTPAEVLSALDARPDQIQAANTIAKDLGPDFTDLLGADLAGIGAGQKVDFGDRAAGRDFEPDEISVIARDAGFGRFEWAPDGCLSLQADGSVESASCPNAPPVAFEFDGRLRVFEALMWKP